MAATFDPAPFEALTFDCYGTLIDWHGGVRGALRQLPSLAGADLEQLVTDRERIDFELIQGEYLPYGEVLRRSLAAAARLQECDLTEEELNRFAEGMGGWPPFAESPGCLARLATRFRLCILSNVETSTLEASVAQLGKPFELVTAEQLRSYKPARAHFDAGLERLELPRERVLHVAQSLIHDHQTALALGWTTAWVDRLHERPAPEPAPHLVVSDLTELCERLNV